jgi:raffinose/stachyose/melibiose transport system permease protein
LVLYVAFMVYPIFWTVFISFFEWSGIQLGAMIFQGLRNYLNLFSTPLFYSVLKNTGILMIFSVFVRIPIGVVLALLLLKPFRGHRFFRSVYFFPVVISSASIALMFSLIYSPSMGIINITLNRIGLGNLRRIWLGDPSVVMYAAIAPMTWQYIGLMMLLSLTGFQSIPEEILEAAEMDGAAGWRRLWYVMLPLNWDAIQVCVIVSVIGSLRSFDHVYILTGGGPNHASEILGIYLYKEAFTVFHFGFASSIATFILIVGFLFSVVFKRYSSVPS